MRVGLQPTKTQKRCLPPEKGKARCLGWCQYGHCLLVDSIACVCHVVGGEREVVALCDLGEGVAALAFEYLQIAVGLQIALLLEELLGSSAL